MKRTRAAKKDISPDTKEAIAHDLFHLPLSLTDLRTTDDALDAIDRRIARLKVQQA